MNRTNRKDRAQSRNRYKASRQDRQAVYTCNVCGVELVRPSTRICKECETFIYRKHHEDL